MEAKLSTVAIIYGLAEGPWLARKFIKTLHQNGFTITDDLYNADIIFAHSLGCYLIPKDATASLIMLVACLQSHYGYYRLTFLKNWPARRCITISEKSLGGGVKN